MRVPLAYFRKLLLQRKMFRTNQQLTKYTIRKSQIFIVRILLDAATFWAVFRETTAMLQEGSFLRMAGKAETCSSHCRINVFVLYNFVYFVG